jgi:hypothetical protein
VATNVSFELGRPSQVHTANYPGCYGYIKNLIRPRELELWMPQNSSIFHYGTYSRDMWQKKSHMLVSLTGLVSPLVKYKWGPEQQKEFDEIKQKVSQETLLAFSDFQK